MKHQIGRVLVRYERRWDIENGFKKLKTFLAETQSHDHRFRYVNFAFACVLYNCWRLVDILVQLELDGEVGNIRGRDSVLHHVVYSPVEVVWSCVEYHLVQPVSPSGRFYVPDG
ncbi:hypothetical protein B1756_13795 [Natrarchaeobaculum aegyptiacum]|uniref:Transposase IS4-like domain-containing protein n=1 Tax=Natrarchaeobaculum aegyptiacum TaxID=745377 RepID=A0A2Z2HTX7_9EURY|nr:hypothetical protein B1756_13795 [Natrarchaeobaculum aegyptiacum]